MLISHVTLNAGILHQVAVRTLHHLQRMIGQLKTSKRTALLQGRSPLTWRMPCTLMHVDTLFLLKDPGMSSPSVDSINWMAPSCSRSKSLIHYSPVTNLIRIYSMGHRWRYLTNSNRVQSSCPGGQPSG